MKIQPFVLIALSPTLALGQQGTWDDAFWFGNHLLGDDTRVAVHLVHVFDGSGGKFLSTTFEHPPGPIIQCISEYARLWTPPAVGAPAGDPGFFEGVPNCRTYLFCQGHSALDDGRVLMVGGFFTEAANLFDPTLPVTPAGPPYSNQWNNPATPPNMAFDRWYPTCTTLPDGRVLVSSGWQQDGGPFATVPELYDPVTNSWAQVASATRQQPLYPYMFVLPDGNLIDAGPGETRFLYTSTWTWSTPIPDATSYPTTPPAPGEHGSAVMYMPGKIMRCGGRDPAVGTTWVMDLDKAAKWLVAGPMDYPRRNHNLVILPDGKVLAVGGNVNGNDSGNHPNPQPVFKAEIFDPHSGQWTADAPSHTAHERWYHSSAMLLPDGRVVSAGGNFNRTGQIYNPPYITSGAPRTTITQAPTKIGYGREFNVEYLLNGGPEVSKASLIRLAATTHGFDHEQRYVPLTFGLGPQPGQVTIMPPANANIAPPGMYMLFLLTEYEMNKFAPCEMAAYVRVGPEP